MIARIRARLYEKEAKETIWSFLTKGTAAVLFVVLNAYLARILGVELWGSWSFLYSLLTVIFLLSYLGLNNAARAFIARYNGTAQLHAVLRDSLLLRSAISASFTTLFLLAYRRIAVLMQHPELATLLPYAAPLIFLMGFSEYLKQVFTGLHRLKYHFFMNLLEFGSKVLFAVLLLGFALRLENILLAFWLALLASVAAGMLFWLRFSRGSGGGGKNFISPILRYSLPLFLISIGFLILTEIDTLMLGLLSSQYEVGQFAVGKQLANKLPQLALALSMGTMPGFAHLNAGNILQMRTKFIRILGLNALVFIPAGILLVLLAPLFVPLVFGAAYGPSVLPLQILMGWVVMTSFNMFFNALLDYQGRACRRAVNFLATMIATVSLNLLLIPRYGAAGAAISTTLAYAPYVLLNGFEARRILMEV